MGLKVKKEALVIGGVVIAVIVGACVLKSVIKSKRAAAEAVDKYTLKAYTFDEISDGYYVKTAEGYYPLPAGRQILSGSNDTVIAKAADPEGRLLSFGQDDALIPTLYKDDELIYKASGTAAATKKKSKSSDTSTANSTSPTSFVFERYRDEGYTIGLSKLHTEESGNRYKTTVTNTTVYPGSSVMNLTFSNGDEVIVDKVGNVSITDENVSVGGTITGLEKGQTYNVEAYCGTAYIGGDVVADTHVFTSYELYNVTNFAMSREGYMQVEIPSFMWSGYYYINGAGLVRYINHNRSEGDAGVDFNTAYFLGKDDNGDPLTNPADGVIQETESKNAADNMKWTWIFNVPEGKNNISIKVRVSEAMDILNGKIEESTKKEGNKEPGGVLTDPSGQTYTLSSSSADGLTLETNVSSPTAGKWTVKMHGMYKRTFDIDIS